MRSAMWAGSHLAGLVGGELGQFMPAGRVGEDIGMAQSACGEEGECHFAVGGALDVWTGQLAFGEHGVG